MCLETRPMICWDMEQFNLIFIWLLLPWRLYFFFIWITHDRLTLPLRSTDRLRSTYWASYFNYLYNRCRFTSKNLSQIISVLSRVSQVTGLKHYPGLGDAVMADHTGRGNTEPSDFRSCKPTHFHVHCKTAVVLWESVHPMWQRSRTAPSSAAVPVIILQEV